MTMEQKASFGRRIGNTFPVTLYVRTFTMGGSLADHVVAVTLINETKGKKENVPCVVEGNEVKFSFTSALQYRLGGTGIYTPVLAVDAGDENLGEADWYRSIEIVPHSVQEYSSGNSGVNIGGVVLQADLALISNGLSAYEMWKADGHEGTLSDYLAWIRKPATDAAAEVSELETALEAAEAAREIEEAARESQESTRQSQETTRQSQESTRRSQESTRQTQESARQSQENTRQTQESGRQTTEQGRVNAETTRGTNEAARAQAEAGRVASENARAQAEQRRAAAEQRRESAMAEAVSGAEEAAGTARDAASQLEGFMAEASEEIDNSTFALGFDDDTGEIYGITGASNTNFDHGYIDDETGEVIGIFNV